MRPAHVAHVRHVSSALTLSTASGFNQSLTVELDNRSPPDFSLNSSAIQTCLNLGFLSRKSISQNADRGTNAHHLLFLAGCDTGDIVPDCKIMIR